MRGRSRWTSPSPASAPPSRLPPWTRAIWDTWAAWRRWAGWPLTTERRLFSGLGSRLRGWRRVGVVPRDHRADHQLDLVEDHERQHQHADRSRRQEHARHRDAAREAFLRAAEHDRDLVGPREAEP